MPVMLKKPQTSASIWRPWNKVDVAPLNINQRLAVVVGTNAAPVTRAPRIPSLLFATYLKKQQRLGLRSFVFQTREPVLWGQLTDHLLLFLLKHDIVGWERKGEGVKKIPLCLFLIWWMSLPLLFYATVANIKDPVSWKECLPAIEMWSAYWLWGSLSFLSVMEMVLAGPGPRAPSY